MKKLILAPILVLLVSTLTLFSQETDIRLSLVGYNSQLGNQNIQLKISNHTSVPQKMLLEAMVKVGDDWVYSELFTAKVNGIKERNDLPVRKLGAHKSITQSFLLKKNERSKNIIKIRLSVITNELEDAVLYFSPEIRCTDIGVASKSNKIK